MPLSGVLLAPVGFCFNIQAIAKFIRKSLAQGLCPGSTTDRRKGQVEVSIAGLIQVSQQADAAFSSFDFSAHAGSNTVRIYLQGYG
jgi:hypothetical protein